VGCGLTRIVLVAYTNPDTGDVVQAERAVEGGGRRRDGGVVSVVGQEGARLRLGCDASSSEDLQMPLPTRQCFDCFNWGMHCTNFMTTGRRAPGQGLHVLHMRQLRPLCRAA
jgi:hypothetical protein